MTRILLLEPDKLLANTYLKALQAAGYEVDVCHAAQSAIHSADKVKPDIVIVELQLVSHSGIEFLYEFRSYADWQDVPIIILTNVPVNEFVSCEQLLMNEMNVKLYLYKPHTSLRKLLQSINELTSANVAA
jgi:DNA-binding response OmpR family regulator